MNKIKVLITGGPVYDYLDPVKIITNRFKGGRIAELAQHIKDIDRENISLTYLTAKGSKVPLDSEIDIIYHNGFYDYKEKVIRLSKSHDGVILGAAVCNLIPLNPLKCKFPSHHYKVGDVIPINFTIAPRIIDEVKKSSPNVKLFGFKLLQGVSHSELIDAAYDIVLESKSVVVFANDANNLDKKYAVTKEKGIIEFDSKDSGMSNFIVDLIRDDYYSTVESNFSFGEIEGFQEAKMEFKSLIKQFESILDKEYGSKKYKFGTVAVRMNEDSNSFITTVRGKKDLKDFAVVQRVDHLKRKVYSSKKATLNAPLLHRIFKNRKDVNAIVHYHGKGENLKTFNYVCPGTKRDSDIGSNLDHDCNAFYIDGHGSFELIRCLKTMR